MGGFGGGSGQRDGAVEGGARLGRSAELQQEGARARRR